MSEAKREVMSPKDLATLEYIKVWTGKLADADAGLLCSPDGSIEVVAADVPTIRNTVEFISDSELKSGLMATKLRLLLAKCVLQECVITGDDKATVISNQGICETFGRRPDTVYQWVRVVENLDHDRIVDAHSMSQLVAVATVPAPKDTKLYKKFNDARNGILDLAAINPAAYPSRQMRTDLEAFALKLEPRGVKGEKTTMTDLFAIALTHINETRLMRAAAINPTLLDDSGITMEQLVNSMEVSENELINALAIPADVMEVSFMLTDDEGSVDEEVAKAIEA